MTLTATDGRPGRPVVWTGRRPAESPGGLDGWSTPVDELARLLDDAPRAVVLDPLSFPWRTWHPRADVPLVVRLPDDVPLDDLLDLLDLPVLRYLTSHDRLLVRDPDVAAAITARYGLPAQVCLLPGVGSEASGAPGPDGDDEWWRGPLARAGAEPAGDGRARTAKQQQRLEVDLVLEALVGIPEMFAAASRVDGVGDDVRTRLLRLAAPADVAVRDPRPPAPRGGRVTGDLLVTPTPQAVVVWLVDGGQDDAERAALIGEAHDRLPPGGRLVVVGYVVDGPHGANPRTSALLGQLRVATSGMVHVEELRSFRLPGEALARGVLLCFSRLGPVERP